MNESFHFIAIGGVGQSALAKLLLIKGFEVTGSDVLESTYTRALEDLGAKIFIGHNANNVKAGRKVVLSSAIKEDNPELIRAKELGLKLFHRSDILKLMSEQYPCFIGFSGTHGKTTTSGLCSYILEKIGAHPAYATGGMVAGLETNANAYPDSKIFVAELDESDGTIIKYSPGYIVINNLEPDHFDFYKNGEKDLIIQFEKFLKRLKPDAKVFINIDDAGAKKLLNLNGKKIITYSLKNSAANYFAGNTGLDYFDLFQNGKMLDTVKMGIRGNYNVYNSLAVLSVLLELGLELKMLKPHILAFSGIKRRFETVYDDGIKIIDDYAHHPAEIAATLAAAKELAKGRIVAVFQPHRYTRLKALWENFLKVFASTDELFVVDVYSAGDKFDTEFNSENFVKDINHRYAKYIKGSMDEAAAEISNYIKEGDFILTIGAGDITKIGGILGRYYEGNRTQN